MKKAIYILIAIVLLASIAMPAQAARLDDLKAEYDRLSIQKAKIESDMLRLQGAFSERQATIAEQQLSAPAEATEEVETIEQEEEVAE